MYEASSEAAKRITFAILPRLSESLDHAAMTKIDLFHLFPGHSSTRKGVRPGRECLLLQGTRRLLEC